MWATDWTLPKIAENDATDGGTPLGNIQNVLTYKPDLQGEFYFEESPSMPSSRYGRWEDQYLDTLYLRRNAIRNPSFETSTTQWNAVNATLTRIAESGAPAGANIMRIIANVATGNANANQTMTAAQRPMTGYFSIAMKLQSSDAAASRSVRLSIERTTTPYTTYASQSFTVTKAWQRFVLPYTVAPADSAQGTTFVIQTSGSNNLPSGVLVDAVMVSETQGGYFDGNVNQDTNYSYAVPNWDGTFNESSSSIGITTFQQAIGDLRMVSRGAFVGQNAITTTKNIERRLRYYDQDFEFDTYGVGGISSTIALDDTRRYGGTRSLRVTPVAGQRARIRGLAVTDTLRYTPMRVVAYVFSETATRARLTLYNGSNVAVRTQEYQSVPANTWTRLQFITDYDVVANGPVGMGVEGETVNGIINVDNLYHDRYLMENYGGASNLFGLDSIRRDDVTRSDFGIAMRISQTYQTGTNQKSQFLRLTGFNLAIPKGATIRGIETRVYVAAVPAFIPPQYPHHAAIYFVQVRAHYDYDAELIGESMSLGTIQFENQPIPEISDKKTYQYNTYRRGEFMGELDDVINQPEVMEAVNTIPGDMSITLARNLDTLEVSYDDIMVAGYGADQALLTTNQDTLMLQYDSVRGIGDGTDIGLNYDVDIIEYYGGYEPLLTSPDGDDLLMADGEPLMIQVGHPRGRRYYGGWVSKFGLRYKNNDSATRVTLLHHGDEMNNIMFETSDTTVVGNNRIDQFARIGNNSNSDFAVDITHAQTFTITTATRVSQIILDLARWGFDDAPQSEWPTATLQLKAGAPNGAGAILDVAMAKVPTPNPTSVPFSFDVLLQPGSYSWLLTVPMIGSKYASPVRTYYGDAYGGGVAWVQTELWSFSGPPTRQWTQQTGFDFKFTVMRRGGETTVPKNSMSPSRIFKDIVDFGKTRGSRLTYTPSSVAEAGTTVSIRFNANKYREAINAVLKSTPSDWYWYLDAGSNQMYLQPRPVNVSQYFTRGDDVEELILDYTLEQLINEVYFTGGGTPALFRRLSDSASQGQWRRGLDTMSDQRVLDIGTAEIMMDGQIDRYNQPLWAGTAKILRRFHDKHVRPGELAQFLNFHPMISELNLQIMSVKTTKYRYEIELGILLPRVSKRIEDIKRNLDRIEAENNPNGPS